MSSLNSTQQQGSSMSSRLFAARERCGLTGTSTTFSNQIPSSSTDDPPSGSELRGVSDDILGRLVELARQTPESSDNRPPLIAYTTTPGPYGDICRASDEWIQWMRHRVPGYGDSHRSQRPPSRRTPDSSGTSDGAGGTGLTKFRTPT